MARQAADARPNAFEMTHAVAVPATLSGKHRLHVGTAVSRPKNLPRLFESLSIAKARNRFGLPWHLVLDTNAVTPTAGLTRYLERMPGARLYPCSEFSMGNRGGPPKNTALDAIHASDDGLIWFLDDDTVCPPDEVMSAKLRDGEFARAYLRAALAEAQEAADSAIFFTALRQVAQPNRGRKIWCSGS